MYLSINVPQFSKGAKKVKSFSKGSDLWDVYNYGVRITLSNAVAMTIAKCPLQLTSSCIKTRFQLHLLHRQI